MTNEKQAKIFNQEEVRKKREKETLLSALSKKNPDLTLLKKSTPYLFDLFSEAEKEKVWEIIKDDIECLLELIRSNRADVFPEKSFSFDTINTIFTSGSRSIIESFIHSQFYRKGMIMFLVCEKHRQFIMDKIGSKTYLEIMKEISRDKKPAKRR